jgi:hypothetical protein
MDFPLGLFKGAIGLAFPLKIKIFHLYYSFCNIIENVVKKKKKKKNQNMHGDRTK